MTFHDHRTPLPAAVPPAARGLPGLEKRAERERIRTFIADRIEAMIALMDRLDGDADLEPSLGASEPFTAGPAMDWTYGSGDDREADAGDDREEENEHGGDIQDQPHDAEEDDDRESGCGDMAGAMEQYASVAWGGYV